jgi:hypothetical protein
MFRELQFTLDIEIKGNSAGIRASRRLFSGLTGIAILRALPVKSKQIRVRRISFDMPRRSGIFIFSGFHEHHGVILVSLLLRERCTFPHSLRKARKTFVSRPGLFLLKYPEPHPGGVAGPGNQST